MFRLRGNMIKISSKYIKATPKTSFRIFHNLCSMSTEDME